jgi:hypothetical protein
MSDDKITLRSYRLAFELERRLHRIDRFRIPVPYGIPLAGLGYAVAIAAGVLVLSGVPVIGALLDVLPWPLKLVVFPGLATRALCRRRADGRPAHEAIAARIAFALSPRQLVALEPRPSRALVDAAIPVAADERAPAYVAGVVAGPGTVVLRRPAAVELRGARARLRQIGDRPLSQPQELQLEAGARLEIVCDPR